MAILRVSARKGLMMAAALVTVLILGTGGVYHQECIVGEEGFVGFTSGCWQTDLPHYEVRVIVKGSVADRLGFRWGDQIIAVDGKEVDPAGFEQEIHKLHRGDVIEITYRRNGALFNVQLKATEYPGYFNMHGKATWLSDAEVAWRCASRTVIGVIPTLDRYKILCALGLQQNVWRCSLENALWHGIIDYTN